MVFDSVFSSAASTSSLAELGGQRALDTEAGYRSLGAERDQEMGLAVPESPIKHSGWPFLTHSHLARVWTTAGSMLGLPSKSKPRRDFSRGTWRP